MSDKAKGRKKKAVVIRDLAMAKDVKGGVINDAKIDWISAGFKYLGINDQTPADWNE